MSVDAALLEMGSKECDSYKNSSKHINKQWINRENVSQGFGGWLICVFLRRAGRVQCWKRRYNRHTMATVFFYRCGHVSTVTFPRFSPNSLSELVKAFVEVRRRHFRHSPISRFFQTFYGEAIWPTIPKILFHFCSSSYFLNSCYHVCFCFDRLRHSISRCFWWVLGVLYNFIWI